MSCGQCSECIAPEGWVCRESGNFYTTGEYSHTIEFFNIHGVSFNQRIDSVKHLLDNNTLQILKVLLQDIDAPFKLNLPDTLDIIATLDLIQSRLSKNDNKPIGTVPMVSPLDYSKKEGDEE